MRGKLRKEIELGQISGPHVQLPLPNLQISPLGIVSKKAQGEFRLIHHLAFAYCGSVKAFH